MKGKAIVILVSFAISLISTALLWKKIKTREELLSSRLRTVRVIVAGKDIKPGETLSAENLRAREIPEETYSRRIIREEEFSLIDGALCSHSIPAGSFLVWDDIQEPIEMNRFSRTLKKGMRAVTVTADERTTFSGLLRPGDRVDVLATEKKDDGTERTILLLENLLVGAINGSFRDEEIVPGESGGTITLITTTTRAASLLRAIEDPSTSVSFILRNPSEKTRKRLSRPSRRVELFTSGTLEKTYTFPGSTKKREERI